ncbi:tRNA (adenosine(37)-N6)-threonylcarbamoyltransferase complex dimerization subunit type 1 TsaB [Candidatus Babeliales bacterium]|nr:tRNA (adenosine(37)-N6)-threonylcarbamoyltransferase complex dimerization subunit type 1 TsaB [Candidatus Babeliales bacterium]MCF7899209.1 tRNA (adenosine(37)-N6)-threonylcarbamoyltransferase complex dimerization subunit type 1 TsaB [Candidatus Babeliales bacterium]
MINLNFLSLQASYSGLELSLYKNNILTKKIEENNRKASSILIPLIQDLLQEYDLKISDLNFICVDHGPGAFTSLRVAITTVNGISFAQKIPLIGIDGLDALSLQTFDLLQNKYKNLKTNLLITLLNAYNDEVFFEIDKIENSSLEKIELENFKESYVKIDLFLEEIRNLFGGENILFSGNAATLHKNLIQNFFQNKAIFFPEILQVSSTEQIAKMAIEKYNSDKNFVYKLLPKYLKSQTFAIKK